MKKSNLIYVEHMLNSILKIQHYTKNVTKEHFEKSDQLQDAVARQLEIIGEASKKISKDIKLKSPDMPWKDMAGMRDKLIHDYFDIDLEVVWTTVKIDLPILYAGLRKIEKLLAE